ncbi:MAG: NifB/NifX family molybdenum-iron cluster-binding protein [Clostridiaceae bacterium]
MKIAIPVNEKSMETSVCISFGRTPYFLIYDNVKKESVFLDNSAAASQGGAGIKAAQSIVDSKANVLLTPRCGENAANVLKAADIKIYKTMNNSLKENLEAFEEGKLQELTEIHSGFHGNGGK